MFRKKNEPAKPLIIDPTTLTPTDAESYVKRGYAFYARGDFARAEEDFRKALSMDSTWVEAHYALALNLKAQNRPDEAVLAFQKALEHIGGVEKETPTRAHMLSRIIKGHINQLTKGNWDLRMEFWGNMGEK
jgi:tetratricopeptide (TPR) repeat protein